MKLDFQNIKILVIGDSNSGTFVGWNIYVSGN